MERFYVYCNTNQAYSALINNSIFANSLLLNDFRSNTFSFQTEDFIFITKRKISLDNRSFGVSDVYYPVAFEITPEACSVPVIFANTTDSGISVSKEFDTLSKYDDIEGCIGAFIFGEIPFSFVSKIIFESDSNKMNFKKSSPDLWFPEDKFCLWSDIDTNEAEDFDSELLAELTKLLVPVIDAEKLMILRNAVVKANKQKAAVYYAIDATCTWRTTNALSNMDSTIIRILDGNDDGKLSHLVGKEINELESRYGIDMFTDFMSDSDSVLYGTTDNINRDVFDHISNALVEVVNVSDNNTLLNLVVDACKPDCEKNSDVASALETISEYMHTPMDPDIALNRLSKLEVLQAAMFFIDQSKNSSFLKNSCRKLNQRARRYAYIMFALYHGMSEVDGKTKSNTLLEHRIEEITLNVHHFPELITLDSSSENEDDTSYGLHPIIEPWFDEKSSFNILQNMSDAELRSFYSEVHSIIPNEKVFALDLPIEVTIKIGDKSKTFNATTTKECQQIIKALTSRLSKAEEKFNLDMFKSYLSKNYSDVYRTYCDKIQSFCKEVKK